MFLSPEEKKRGAADVERLGAITSSMSLSLLERTWFINGLGVQGQFRRDEWLGDIGSNARE